MPQLDLGSVLGPQGPKGDPGNQGTVGPRGPQGEQGDAGKDATINGVNALQISVGQGLKESQEGGTYSIAMGDEDYKNLQNAKGAVRFDQAQTMTPAQQEQAQHNIGTTWPCNPNLLDNWYFGNPVDQRGGMLQLAGTMLYSDAACTQAMFGSAKTTSIVKVSNIAAHPIDDSTVYVKLADCVRGYTGNGYTIDRWKMEIDIGTVTVDSDGIILDGGANGITLNQQSDTALVEALRGKIVTQSVMYTVLQQTGAVGGFGTEVPGQYIARVLLSGAIGSKTVSSATITMPDNLHSFAWFYLPPGCKIKIYAVKVELGPTQTLAHQDAAGNWVLNEVPEYGEQLRRCQRYCRVYKAGEYLPCLGYPETDGWYLQASLYIGGMRTTPALNIGSGIDCSVSSIDSGDPIDKKITSWGLVGGTVQKLRISGEGFTKGPFPYNIMPKKDIILSADL